MGPIEKSEITPGRPLSIGVKQVVSADVILINGLLDQAHPENLGIELVIGPRLSGDRGDMMDSKQFGVHKEMFLT